MSFLNKLLTLENSLQDGEEILRFPRTLRDYLPWNKKQPFCYKAHRTRGGLYLILPHNRDDSLFLGYPKQKCIETKEFYVPYPSIDSFSLEQVAAKRDTGLCFASLVGRTAFHPETKTGIRITVSYGATSEAVPIHLHIKYRVLLHKDHYKKVSFEVFRNRDTNTISARGPEIETNMSRNDLWPVHYEATLENLVDLITEPHLSPEQFSPLLTDAYVELHTLH